MTQDDAAASKPQRKKRAVPDEGAAYTAQVMAEVSRLRRAKKWSAERLAEEMAAAGVPWSRDTVTNLESGRRKRIAAHEVLALAWVLGLSSPVELLAPGEELTLLQVTPEYHMPAENVREWFAGKIGPIKNFEKTIKNNRAIGEKVSWAIEELQRRGYPDNEIVDMLNEIFDGKSAASDKGSD
jgi:transcriptional regulator with XRE-family HTH domain